MKTIIAGSRGITDLQVVVNAAMNAYEETDIRITSVVSGAARGVDRLGEQFALGVPIKRFPALWKQHGKSAGFIRNHQMAQYADALIAVWDGESRGTKNMIDQMKRLDKPVYVYQT